MGARRRHTCSTCTPLDRKGRTLPDRPSPLPAILKRPSCLCQWRSDHKLNPVRPRAACGLAAVPMQRRASPAANDVIPARRDGNATQVRGCAGGMPTPFRVRLSDNDWPITSCGTMTYDYDRQRQRVGRTPGPTNPSDSRATARFRSRIIGQAHSVPGGHAQTVHTHAHATTQREHATRTRAASRPTPPPRAPNRK